MAWRKKEKAEASPTRLLLWTAFAAFIVGIMGFGEIAEDVLRSARNGLHPHKASGDVVLVKIDDKSIEEFGRWPWPRGRLAEVTDRLTDAQAAKIMFDFILDAPTTETEDRRLEDSLERSRRVALSVMPNSGPNEFADDFRNLQPLPRFAKHSRLVSIDVRYNWQNAVWRVPYSTEVGGQRTISASAFLAGVAGDREGDFVPDYSLDPSTIPSVSASDVLNGRVDAKALRGKQLVVAPASVRIGDEYFIPGTGRMPGAYVHVVGAETLKTGRPVYFGWVPLLIAAIAVAALALSRPKPVQRFGLPIVGTAIILFATAVTDAYLIFFDIVPAAVVLVTLTSVMTWRAYRARGLVDPVSGLPNLTALRIDPLGKSRALVAARILNYAEITATLPPQSERQLIDQVIGRLSVGATDRRFYHGDGGIIAWFEDARVPFGNQIDALHAMFRNPVKVSGMPIDISVSFGVEIGSNRSLANRLGSALLAAEEAAHDGLRWKYHDPDALAQASWRLSILSQLDSAIDNGEVWIAYQPKLDLQSRRIIGAEALARWTHPEKGPIAASEFVAAAEQNDRIGKLTDFVLERAVAAAARINQRGTPFSVAVNLSARLLTDKTLSLRLAALLAREKLAPVNLTLELTETTTISENGEAMEMLARLRELGITISIDDYGTGLSTLDYLKKVPASEIKIDQSFVKAMLDNRGDRVMVQSTIALAHSLGRRVVAEGVEQPQILDALIEMKCDVAQGYVVGRPMTIDLLMKRLTSERSRGAA